MNTQMHPDELSRLALSAADFARVLDISLRHFSKLNSTGRIPRPIRFGRTVRWRWMRSGNGSLPALRLAIAGKPVDRLALNSLRMQNARLLASGNRAFRKGSRNVIVARNRRLKSALAYAEVGFYVFPLYEACEGRCSCRNANRCKHPGKHPRTRHGVKDASTDPDCIERWWKKWPGANVAIATGSNSGILVIDIDPKHGGSESFRQLVQELGPLPDTTEAKTGGDGQHFLFRHPGGRVVNCQGILPGIDIKGDGGYIAADPSRHASGRYYKWEPSHDPWSIAPAELPDSWLTWLRKAGCYREVEITRDGGHGGNGDTDETEAIASFSSIPTDPDFDLDEISADDRDAILAAIQRNRPEKPGQRNGNVFEFARELMGIPSLRNAPPEKLRPLCDAHFQAIAPVTSGTHDSDGHWNEFAYAWERVRFPGRFNLLEVGQRVKECPPHPACAMLGYTSPTSILMVGI
jgi:hypothetical protein